MVVMWCSGVILCLDVIYCRGMIFLWFSVVSCRVVSYGIGGVLCSRGPFLYFFVMFSGMV